MRIGLFLQDLENENWEKRYNEVLALCNKAKLDLLVFPENTLCPNMDELEASDIFDIENEGYEIIKNHTLEISKQAGCAVIFCHFTNFGQIYSVYGNEQNETDDTRTHDYVKYTATEESTFDMKTPLNHDDFGYDFIPISLKGYIIGRTICYDSTFPLFSRMCGLENIDILINSTGGHVDYKKWSYFQKVRAIENKCFNLCVMANYDNSRKNKSYVFAYDRFGCKLPLAIVTSSGLEKNVSDNSIKDALYIFDIDKLDLVENKYPRYEYDEYLDQKASTNKNIDVFIDVKNINSIVSKAVKVAPDIYCKEESGYNLILCMVYGNDILIPEKISELEYNEKLKKIENKRYLIINKWDKPVSNEFFNGVLSNVLKVRAVENYSALIFYDGKKELCLQTGKNKNAQIVERNHVNGYGLDFARMTGPEAIWRTSKQVGIKAEWREGYEDILKYIIKNRN